MIFLFVLFGALLHATWNVLIKKSSDTIVAMGQICFFASILAFVALFFFPFPEKAVWGYLISSIIVHWCYKFCLLQIYRTGEVGVVYPIFRGLAPIFFIIFSILILGAESFYELSWKDFFAILLILCSVLFINSNIAIWKQKKVWKPFKIAILVACCIALYSSLDAKAALLTSPHSYISWLFFLDNLGFLIFCFWKKRNLFSHINFIQGLGGGSCYFFSYWIVVYAWSVSNAIIIASLREVSVVFAVILASIFLKEKWSLRKIFFAGTIFVGIFLLKNNFS